MLPVPVYALDRLRLVAGRRVHIPVLVVTFGLADDIQAQFRRAGPCRRRVLLNQQPERGSIPGPGPPDQITVADVHTS